MSKSEITHCIGTYNNIEYLKLAVKSVRKYSHFKDSPFIIYAENCTDGTNEWLSSVKDEYNLKLIFETNRGFNIRGIGGSMNLCAELADTKYINFLHSDFYVTPNWDLELYKLFDKYPNDHVVASSHRIQPNIFNEDSRPGTLIVPENYFGAYHYDFSEDDFVSYATEFSKLNNFEIRKGEGVSFMITKDDWMHVGGNDHLFSPTSYEDIDLFIRMQLQGYKFVLTSQSVIWHFGARGSHRLEENNGKSSNRQIESERKNKINWINKWGSLPEYDRYGFIKIPQKIEANNV